MKRTLILIGIALLLISACSAAPTPAPTPTATAQPTLPTAAPTRAPSPTLTRAPAPSLSLTLAKKIALTTDAEGGSARPEIIATQNRIFIVYLGNIGQRDGRTFNAKIFDANLENVIAKKTLAPTTSEHGGPTDIRVASDGKFLYAFYETHKPISQTSAATWLWGAKYTLDDKFERVAHTAQPITTSKPLTELSDGGELLDDPAPLVGPASGFVTTRIKYSAAKSGKTVYRVREFNKDNLAKLSEFDLDLSAAIDERARVASLLYSDNSIYIALATSTAEQVTVENDDGVQSNLAVVRMKSNWTFDAQKDVRTISATPDDVENYIAGLDADDNNFYVTYKQSVGKPPTGDHRAWIKIFDREWNLVQQQQVKTALWGPGGGEIRPSLEAAGNRIFSGQSSSQGIGRGNAEIYVYEMKKETRTGELPPQAKQGTPPAPAQGKQITPSAITPPQSKQGTLPAPKSSSPSGDTAQATTITTVTNPTSGAKLFVAVYTPKDTSKKYPAVVLVPGGNGDSSGFTRPNSRGDSTVGEFVNGGFVAIAFDPDDRGKSEGKEDYAGSTHQDGLAAVVKYAATLSQVDAKQIGIVTYSYGITMGSGALARYSDLPVKFLIDWEGPADRNDTGGCDGQSKGHLQTVAKCTDEKFWSEREAATFIAKIRVPYQRVQSEKDHVQSDNSHAVNIVNAAVKGGAPWVRLNDYQPNQTYDPQSPPQMFPETQDRQRDAAIIKYAQELMNK